jgi:hypothetical protein
LPILNTGFLEFNIKLMIRGIIFTLRYAGDNAALFIAPTNANLATRPHAASVASAGGESVSGREGLSGPACGRGTGGGGEATCLIGVLGDDIDAGMPAGGIPCTLPELRFVGDPAHLVANTKQGGGQCNRAHDVARTLLPARKNDCHTVSMKNWNDDAMFIRRYVARNERCCQCAAGCPQIRWTTMWITAVSTTQAPDSIHNIAVDRYQCNKKARLRGL